MVLGMNGIVRGIKKVIRGQMFDSWTISVLSTSLSMLGDSGRVLRKCHCTGRCFRGRRFIGQFLLSDFPGFVFNISPAGGAA